MASRTFLKRRLSPTLSSTFWWRRGRQIRALAAFGLRLSKYAQRTDLVMPGQTRSNHFFKKLKG